jgi:nicotinate-nucleotide adenylyltransferase
VTAIQEIIKLAESNTEKKSTNEKVSVAIMGGTFDPIHNGHLRIAVDIVDRFHFTELRLVPCFIPVHKSHPSITAKQRLEMVSLAVKQHPDLLVDDREIKRTGRSYSIDTLIELRQELGPDACITMVMGMDSFISLPSWHKWQSILNYAHILVVSRPGWHPEFTLDLQDLIEKSRAKTAAELQSAPAGKIHMEALTELGISSSMIRTLCEQNKSIAYLLPESVHAYIDQHTLYQ